MNPRAQSREGEVWYHGSPDRFDRFRSTTKHTFGSAPSETPIFLTRDRAFAALYAGPNGYVYRVRPNVKHTFDANTFVTSDRYWPPPREDLTAEGQALHDDLVNNRIFPEMIRYGTKHEDEDAWQSMHDSRGTYASIFARDYDVLETTEMKRWLVAHGYDSFLVSGDGPNDNLAVMDPSRLEIVGVEPAQQGRTMMDRVDEERPLTEQQRRALDYLARHDGWMPAKRLPTDVRMVLDRLARKKELVHSLPLGGNMAFFITAAGRAAIAASTTVTDRAVEEEEEYHGSFDSLPIGAVLRGEFHKEELKDSPIEQLLEKRRPTGALSRLDAVFMVQHAREVRLAGGSDRHVYEVQPMGVVSGPYDGGWYSKINREYFDRRLADKRREQPDGRFTIDLTKYAAFVRMADSYWSGKPCIDREWCSGTQELLAREARIVRQIR